MPTGITHIIDENDASFERYLWRCVRGMAISMRLRDESMDTPFPEQFEVSEYTRESLRSAQARVREMQTMTLEQAEVISSSEHARYLARWEESKKRSEEMALRYEQMKEKVLAWTPPTDKHAGLKKFALDQLTTGAPYRVTEDRRPEAETPEEWLERKQLDAARDLERASADLLRETERVKEDNEWLAALRASVPQPE